MSTTDAGIAELSTAEVPAPVDLTNCDREPIHVPGAIQPHGALVVLREPDITICQVSANAPFFLGAMPRDLLGRPLGNVVTQESLASLVVALADERPQDHSPLPIVIDGKAFDGSLHRWRGATVLELEPTGKEPPDGACAARVRLKAVLTRIEATRSTRELFDVAVRDIRQITGYDRVLLYRFDEDGHGVVIAEERRSGLESFLGLHYPASDIPRQARELYTLSWLRIIPDRTYEPVPIVPGERPDTGEPLDLTFSILRSVSPVHLEYMRNIGFRASMSISIIVEGRLWGLVSCSHETPRYVPCAVRDACELIARFFSSQVGAKQRLESLTTRDRRRSTVTQIATGIGAERDVLDALIRRPPNLLDVVEAGGAAVYSGGRCRTIGQTPRDEQIRMLVGWLRATAGEELYATNALPRSYPVAAGLEGVASGVLAFWLPKPDPEYVLWFRPEIVQTVTWGGDPSKPVESTPDGGRLGPRKSFAQWKEFVRGASQPWSAADLEAATELRRAVIERDLSRQVEREHSARTAAEASQMRFLFLREAGSMLTSNLDYEATLRNVAHLSTDRFADVCVIDLIDEAAVPRRVQVQHANRALQETAEGLFRYMPSPGGGPIVSDGRAKLWSRLSSEALREALAYDDAHVDLLWNRLRVRSLMIVPLVARGRILGQILFMAADSGRLYDEADLALADELARRASIAIENAGLYRRMLEALEEAHRATRDRDELIAVVSHDINNPLAAIVASTSTILHAPDLAAEALAPHLRVAVERIKRSASRIQALLRNLLDVHKIREGRFIIEPTVERIGPLVQETLESMRSLADRKHIVITERVDEPDLEVRADRERVFQVLSNLLGNAFKFTPAGGAVSVEITRSGEEACVTVRDTGPGISAEHLTRIFERYWRAKAVEGGGTGLGLFIAKGVVEAHGGRIWAESTPGAGSSFCFTLPLG